MENQQSILIQAVHERNKLSVYRDKKYEDLIIQLNTRASQIIKDDLGSQFVQNCGRDLAGEVVRTFFDSSDYYITVDQLATRILKFTYEDEYDPLKENGSAENIRKDMYNYNDFGSSTLDSISNEWDSQQEKLFVKIQNAKGDTEYKDKGMMKKAKDAYADSRTRDDGTIIDEYTDLEGEYITTKKGTNTRRQEVEHTQAAATATYASRYTQGSGIDSLKRFYNSFDNFAMMDKSANGSKGDVRVYSVSDSQLEIEKKQIFEDWKKMHNGEEPNKTQIADILVKKGIDITHRATPEQLAEATCNRWEKTSGTVRKNLIDKGYLTSDGVVPKSVKTRLTQNLRHSQNEQSKVILKNTNYGVVGKDALSETKASMGRILAGQIIYYAAPPLVFEIKRILKDKRITLGEAIQKIKEAGKQIGNYIVSKLGDIFKNVVFNSLKKFIKTFMDILINMVKATVKKMLRLAKSLLMAVVDSAKIIATSGTSPAQKADSVFALFGITITNFVIEILFELLEEGLHIPEFLLTPLQILTSVVCSNLVMLVLQKADLFDVRFGFNRKAIQELFANERAAYEREMMVASSFVDVSIQELIEKAETDCKTIYLRLQSIQAEEESVRESLQQIDKLFGMNIDFDDEWRKFVGQYELPTFY